jgi:hypothetical protein
MTPIEFLSNVLSNFLLAVSQNPWLQGILGLWLLLGLFNRDHRQKLVDNIAYFLRMPLTYDDTVEADGQSSKDPHPPKTDDKNQPLYPRRWFEDASKGLKKGLASPFEDIKKKISTLMEKTVEGLNWNSALGGILLALFIYADVIGGINIISLVPGLIDWEVPVLLREYSITIIAGTILSVFVSAWIHGSMDDQKSDKEVKGNKVSDSKITGEKDENASAGTSNPTRRNIARFLLISSLVTIIGINLIKLPVFIDIFSDSAERLIELISGFFLHVVVMFNAALATYLLDAIGRKGLVLLALPVLFPIYIVSGVLNFFLIILASLGPVAVDIVVRIIFITMNIVAFYVIAPIDLGGNVLFRNSQTRRTEN